jgi:hypothetical protein
MTPDRTGGGGPGVNTHGGGFEGLLDLLTGPLCSQRERDPGQADAPDDEYIYWSN